MVSKHDGDAVDPERGRRIQQLRRQRGYTSARALADAVGVHPRAVDGWEAGKPMNGPNLARLAEVLQRPPRYVWAGEEDDESADPLATLRRDVDALRGELAQHDEQGRFVRSALERLTQVEADLAQIRDLLVQQAADLQPVVTAALRGAADRRSSEEAPPGRGERRVSAGRRRSDPPPEPGP